LQQHFKSDKSAENLDLDFSSWKLPCHCPEYYAAR